MYDKLDEETNKGKGEYEVEMPGASFMQRVINSGNVTEYQKTKYDKNDFRAELEQRPKLFIHWLLQDHLPPNAIVPDFHEEMFKLMVTPASMREDGKDFLQIMAFRSSAKTMICVAAVCFKLLFRLSKCVMYVSSTTNNALAQTSFIHTLLCSRQVRDVFGDVRVITHNKSIGRYEYALGDSKRVLMAKSMEQDPRGNTVDNMRADMMIFDDVETSTNSDTLEKSKALELKMIKDFIPAADVNNAFFVQIGNLVNEHSMMLRREENPGDVHCVRFPAITPDGKITWPEGFGVEAMKKAYRRFQLSGQLPDFFAEFMNVLVPRTRLVEAEEIEVLDPIHPGDVLEAFITIDPAISQKVGSDDTAIVVHAHTGEYKDGKPVWVIAEIMAHPQFTVITMWEAIKILSDKWRCKLICIENVGFQQLFFTIFTDNARRQGYDHLIFEGVKAGKTAKMERIRAWASYLKVKEYKICRNALAAVTQLMAIDPTKKDNRDDIVDACAYGVQVITKYRHRLKIQNANSDLKPAEPTLKLTYHSPI